MPFTPAHVAAVLPWVGRERPPWAVPAALVVGSMVPDVLYFVPISSHRQFSHSLEGVLTLDLALGLLFVGLWRLVAAPVVRDLAPVTVRTRMPPPSAPTPAQWRWSVPCVLLGALTHVVWDAFTHVDGWVVRRVPALSDAGLGGLPAFKLAQYGSGVLGTALVLAHVLRPLARAPGAHPGTSQATAPERRAAWAVLVLAPVVAGLGFAVAGLSSELTSEMLLYVVVVRGISALGLAATAVAAWWHLRILPRGKGRPAPRPGPPARAADRSR